MVKKVVAVLIGVLMLVGVASLVHAYGTSTNGEQRSGRMSGAKIMRAGQLHDVLGQVTGLSEEEIQSKLKEGLFPWQIANDAGKIDEYSAALNEKKAEIESKLKSAKAVRDAEKAKVDAMTQEEKEAYFKEQKENAKAEMEKIKAMTPEERVAYMAESRANGKLIGRGMFRGGQYEGINPKGAKAKRFGIRGGYNGLNRDLSDSKIETE